MAALNFPNSPSTNDLHTENGLTFKWNGTIWKKVGPAYTDTTNLNVTGIGTIAGNFHVGGVLTYEDVKNVDSVGIITARTGIAIPNDTYKLRSGTDLEMQVWHDGTNSIVKDTRDSGKVRIQADNFDIIDKDASETMLSATVDGAVQLYHNGTRKAYTNSGGFALDSHLIMGDGDRVKLGNGADIQIYHDGANNQYLNATGDTVFQGGTSNSIILRNNAAVELYHNGNKKFESYSHGNKVTGNLWCVDDAGKALFGANTDLQISHDGTNNLINNHSADLHIVHGTEIQAKFIQDGAVELYHDNSRKLSTLASGIKVERTDATQSYITMATSAGDCGFLFANSNTDIQLMDREGHPFLKGVKDAEVQLYYDNSERFITTNNGAELSGGGRFVIDGNATGGTARINMTRSDHSWGIHNETNYRIYSSSGNTETPSNLRFEIASGGSTDLYYNTTKVFATTSTGGNFYPGSDSTSVRVYGSNGSTVAATIGSTNSDEGFFRAYDAGTMKTWVEARGIAFNGDTQDANFLDDYEEGSFSATVSSAGFSNVNCVDEYYIKIGRQVWFGFRHSWSGSQNWADYWCYGLPFTQTGVAGVAYAHWQDGGSYNFAAGRITGTQIQRINFNAAPSHNSSGNFRWSGVYMTT